LRALQRLADLRLVGGNVNLEVDVLAKYVESLLEKRTETKKSRLSEEYLKKRGF
jgi:riboflavin synthase alpha subunit